MFQNLFFKVGFLTFLAIPLSAQENNLSQLLNSQGLLNGSEFSGSLLEQFSDGMSNDEISNPTSKMPEIKNLQDDNLSKNSNLIKPQISEEMSKVEEYYKILTSEILPVFGQNSFAPYNNRDLLFYNIVDRNYRLAPADVINITIRGQNPLDKKYQISSNGTIILPDLQPIHLEGYNLDTAEKKLLDMLKIDDFSASVSVSLQAARLVPVQITGAARKPQTIAIPAYTPLSRLIPLVGGINKNGSFRNITLTDSSNQKTYIDLYDLLRDKNDFKDHLIKESTRLHINDIGLSVATSGFVGRASIFELSKDTTKISVEELLDLSNTKMIPPGAILQILRFDQDGVIQKQKISKNDSHYINSGEAINIELRQTKNTNNISVKGAVLKAYEIYGKNPQSLAEILKFGASLQENAILDFAIITSRSTTKNLTRSVDLRFAFENPKRVLINPGESIIVLNQDMYNYMLAIAEDYERRIDNVNNLSTINEFQIEINETPENKESNVNAQADNNNVQKNNAINNNAINNKKISALLGIQNLLRITQKIYIDNKVVELIPDVPRNSAMPTIKEKVNLPRDLNLDFALEIKNFGKTNRSITSFSLMDVFHTIEKNGLPPVKNAKLNIKLFTNQYLISMLKSKNNTKLKQNEIKLRQRTNELEVVKNEIENTRPLKIFINDKLSHVVSQNINLQESIGFKRLITNPEIYPFFVRSVEIKNSNNLVAPSPQYSSLLDMTNGHGNLAKVEFFTNSFVINILANGEIELTDILEDEEFKENPTDFNQMGLNQMGLNQMGLNQMGLNQMGSNQMGLNQMGSNQMGSNQIDNINEVGRDEEKEFEHWTIFKRNSKLISGALEKPGFYPIIGEVTLEDLISISGGLLPGADLENITIREYGNYKGETSIIGTKYIDITSIEPQRVILGGHFTVYVPYLVNNADVGTIEVEGEVLHPGTYSFSRNETLEEILVRAGGFTKTAYPLGASFHRESLKKEQKLSNANLAREVEQSILFLSQSQLSGAGDQIKAVVAYANQLKKLPTSGKQTLNIEGSSKKMLLQNGDKLFIPKRPSHVTISGSVQNPVTLVYNPKKSLDEYIAEAGGFKRLADKKRIFVLLPNGKNMTLSSLQDAAIIPAGSVIVVPPKTDKLSALGLTDIWSRVLGNIATSILAINAATQ